MILPFNKDVRVHLSLAHLKKTSVTSDDIFSETKEVRRQISALEPTEVIVDRATYIVGHKFVWTMVDSKVCQAVTGTSAPFV